VDTRRSHKLPGLGRRSAGATGAVVVAAACALLAGPPPAARAQTSVGGRAPNFSVRTVQGTVFTLSAQRGKVVVLDFLLPGCAECQLEARPLDRVAARFRGRGVRVLILDTAGVGNSLLRSYYLGQLHLRFALVASDPGYRVSRRYRITSVGTTVIVGRDGRIRWRGSWLGRQRLLARRIAAASR